MTEQNHRSWKHLIWIPINAVLAFGLPFLAVHTAKLPPDAYFITAALVTTALIIFYTRKTDFRWGAALKTGWALGIIMGIFFGLAILATASVSKPGIFTALTRPDAAPHLWRGMVYGLANALLVSVFPFIVIWRSLAGANPRMFRKGYVTLAAAVSVTLMSVLYNLGMTGLSGENFEDDVKKSLITSVPTIISGSPLATPISNIFLQVSETSGLFDRGNRAELQAVKQAKSKTVPGGIN